MNEVPIEGNEVSTQELQDYQGTARTRAWVIAAVLFFILLVVGLVFAVIAMVSNPSQTETVRDIVIIFMAVESLLIGLVLIVLIVQLARLTALLQDEVKPILDSTNETISTLRGTTAFLSNNLVKPVVKINSSITALRRALELLRPGRTRER
jgi:ABC-type methionine transport system permease subunit